MPAPALLIHGPTGCGKTDICSTLLEKMYPFSNARISCDSYSTSKQLLRAIWIEVIYTKFKFDNISASNKSSRNFLAYQNSFGCRTPSNFGDLATLLGPFLDTFLGCKNSFYSTHNISGTDSAEVNDTFDKEDSNTLNGKSKKGGGRSVNIHGYNPCDGSRREGVLYLFLDRIDAVERLERGLTNGLLRLSEVSTRISDLMHRRSD